MRDAGGHLEFDWIKSVVQMGGSSRTLAPALAMGAWLAVTGAAGAGVCVAAPSMTGSEVFTSTATVALLFPSAQLQDSEVQRLIGTQARLMRGNRNLESVARSTGTTATALQGRVRTEVSSTGTDINVYAEGPSADASASLASSVVNTWIRTARSDRLRQRQDALRQVEGLATRRDVGRAAVTGLVAQGARSVGEEIVSSPTELILRLPSPDTATSATSVRGGVLTGFAGGGLVGLGSLLVWLGKPPRSTQ